MTEAVATKAPQQTGMKSAITPLVYDLALPVGTYYLATAAPGASMITGFIASGLVSLARLVYTAIRDRELNMMSAVVLVVNVASVALSFTSGSVRVVSGKDAAISSVVGIGILYSVLRGRPVLAEALRPFITRGRPDVERAWDRLADTVPFRRVLRVHSAIFGAAFVVDCTVRVVCACVAPVSMLAWIGTAATVGALVVGAVVGGGYAVERLDTMINAEIAEPRSLRCA